MLDHKHTHIERERERIDEKEIEMIRNVWHGDLENKSPAVMRSYIRTFAISMYL